VEIDIGDRVKRKEERQCIRYTVDGSGNKHSATASPGKMFRFYVPGKGEKLNIAFFSCNGVQFREDFKVHSNHYQYRSDCVSFSLCVCVCTRSFCSLEAVTNCIVIPVCMCDV